MPGEVNESDESGDRPKDADCYGVCLATVRVKMGKIVSR